MDKMTFTERAIKMLDTKGDSILTPLYRCTDTTIELGGERLLSHTVSHFPELEQYLNQKYSKELLGYRVYFNIYDGEAIYVSMMVDKVRIDIGADITQLVSDKRMTLFYKVNYLRKEKDREQYLAIANILAQDFLDYMRNISKYRLYFVTENVKIICPPSLKGEIGL